jgi:tRNA A-37 threonylcarbamoyl transferase component Bud32
VDESRAESFRPALPTLIRSPEKLDGFEPLQAKKGRPAHVFRFRVGGRSYVGKWSRSHNVFDRARNLLRKPKAERAWENSTRLRALGFDTPAPIAFAERRKAGLVRRSLLVTEDIGSVCKLDQFLRQFCADTEARQFRRSLVRLLGATLARLHKAGVFQSDLRAANILVEQARDGLKLHLVDTEAVRFCQPVTDSQRLKNMTTLNFTFVTCVTITDRMRVFRSYADAMGMNRAQRKGSLRRTVAACERSMHFKVFKPKLRDHRIPSGLPYRQQVKAITAALTKS